MMGKNLNSVFNEMLEMNLSINIELIKRYASLSIPGFITFEGKDIDSNFINQDDIQSFIQDNYSKFEINIEKFNEHIEEIRLKDKSDDAMLDCLKKSEALCYNSEQTMQVLLCICSTVRKIIFLIKDIIPSEINDNEKDLVILIDCALERMLGANDYYAHLIHDSLSPFLQKDIEIELKKHKDKKSLLLVSYRQMSVSSMSYLSQMTFNSMFVMFLYQMIDKYFNGQEENKTDIKADIIKYLDLQLIPMKRRVEKLEEKDDHISKQLDHLIDNTEQSAQSFKEIIKKQEETDHKIERRNLKEKARPLKQTTCLDAIREVYLDGKYNYPQQFELHEFSIKKKLSAWNQYLKTDGKKGEPPLPEFADFRCTTKATFKTWVVNTFFPYYRDHSKKYDALKSAIHGVSRLK